MKLSDKYIDYLLKQTHNDYRVVSDTVLMMIGLFLILHIQKFH